MSWSAVIDLQVHSLAGSSRILLETNWGLCSNQILGVKGCPLSSYRHSNAFSSGSPLLGARKRSPCVRTSARLGESTATLMMPDFYSVLGLPKDVCHDDIKTAYRQMARKYHPDVCRPEELEDCTRIFIAVQEAYETLSDPRRRALYDQAIAGTVDALGISGRWPWQLEDEETMLVSWKSKWMEQLDGLKRRSAAKTADQSDSWAARMRRKRQEEVEATM